MSGASKKKAPTEEAGSIDTGNISVTGAYIRYTAALTRELGRQRYLLPGNCGDPDTYHVLAT